MDDAVVKLWVLATIAGIVLAATACSVSASDGLATTAQPSVLSSPASEPDYSSVLHPELPGRDDECPRLGRRAHS
ncbi:hypothetical protein ACFWAY_22370 [Rhodococcus sp. NPDC059968]|uniref:hypothetical protein n=1 Tax=Rhodococcus sp. NPDC059968 TaxID=3347017 RepID=UPI00366E6A3B